MTQNLDYGTRIDGSVNQTNNGVVEKHCYDNLESNCAIYGGLYQWDELMNYTSSSSSNPSGRQGICPAGWHVPSAPEWNQLVVFLGGEAVAGGLAKEKSLAHWLSPNSGATNTSGFTALPGGESYAPSTTDIFWHLDKVGFFWSSTELDATNSLYRSAYYADVTFYQDFTGKLTGLSARCLRD